MNQLQQTIWFDSQIDYSNWSAIVHFWGGEEQTMNIEILAIEQCSEYNLKWIGFWKESGAA